LILVISLFLFSSDAEGLTIVSMSLDKSEYGVGDQPVVTITDPSSNLDPNQIDSVNVDVRVLVSQGYAGTLIATVGVQETEPDSGVFSGALNTITLDNMTDDATGLDNTLIKVIFSSGVAQAALIAPPEPEPEPEPTPEPYSGPCPQISNWYVFDSDFIEQTNNAIIYCSYAVSSIPADLSKGSLKAYYYWADSPYSCTGEYDQPYFDEGSIESSTHAIKIFWWGDPDEIVGPAESWLHSLESQNLAIKCESPAPEPTPEPVTPTDSDGDGVADDNDDCPNEYGPSWNNGCPEPTQEPTPQPTTDPTPEPECPAGYTITGINTDGSINCKQNEPELVEEEPAEEKPAEEKPAVEEEKNLEKPSGSVGKIVGDVKVKRASSDSFKKLTFGSKFYPGDIIKTGSDGQVKLFLGNSQVNLHKNTQFEVEEDSSTKTTWELLKGKMHAILECTGKACIQKTTVAIFAVRGTEYILTSEQGIDVIHLKEGALDVTNLVTDETRFIVAGITVTIDSETIKVEPLANDQWNALTDEFTFTETAQLDETEEITEDQVSDDETERATMTTEMQEKSDNGGGCLIATATFGSELAPQVQQLRELRDNTLLETESGSKFMESFNQFYYSFSPTIADWERQNPMFKEAVKLGITPLITSLSILNYVNIDSEAEILGYGISLILLNVGMYFVAPAILIHRIIKR